MSNSKRSASEPSAIEACVARASAPNTREFGSVLRLRSIAVSGLIASCTLLASGCGAPAASSPAAESPKTDADTAPSSSPAKEESTPSESEPAPVSKRDESSARAVLLHEGTAFLLNHEKSDIGIKANEACEKRSNGDLAKKANCSSKALNGMKREGFMLEAPKGGDDDEDEEAKDSRWIYVGFNIEKGIKVETNRVEVEVGAGSGDSLTIKTKGPDKAKRRQGSVASEITFTVPDEYTVIVNESARGKLVYEPKLGLFAGDN